MVMKPLLVSGHAEQEMHWTNVLNKNFVQHLFPESGFSVVYK